MKSPEPVDYLAAIEQFRQEVQSKKSQIHAPDFVPPQPEVIVDYMAISKAWEKKQSGKHKIHLHAKKRNPSHDPEK